MESKSLENIDYLKIAQGVKFKTIYLVDLICELRRKKNKSNKNKNRMRKMRVLI